MHDKHLNRVLILLLIVISSIYVFANYHEWLTPSCIAPVGADVKFHEATVHLFLSQLETFGFIYPVDFVEDVAGFYWYIRAPIPIIVPAIFNLFLSFNAAFYLVYMLAYILLILAMYSFAKELTSKYTAFLISVFFLFSAASNMVFSVGGNYQFFLGLIFFLFLCKYFLLYTKDATRKNLFLWILFAALTGLTYTFSMIFFTSFALLYLVIHRDFKKIPLIFIPLLLTGFFLLPVYITNSYMNIGLASKFISPMETLKTYILPTTLTGWIYLQNTNYKGQLDFNHGPHIYLIGLVFLILLFRKEKTHQYKFIKVYLASMLIWLFLGYLSNIIYLGPISVFLQLGVGSERILFHTYLAFLFIAAYGINKFKIVHWKSLVLTTAVGMVALGTSFLKSKLFFVLIPFYAVAFAKMFLEKEKSKEIIISSLIMYLLLFPLSGKVETTNLEPRPSAINIDGIQDFVKPGEVFYFKGGWSLEQTIITCAKARSIIQIDRDRPISGLNDEIAVLDQSENTKQKLESRGINKIVIVIDQILDGDKINPNKVAHLVKWYGEPKIFQPKNYYPFLVFDTKVNKTLKREIKSPIYIGFDNFERKETFMTDVEYHPWWQAYDENNNDLDIKNRDGFIEVQGAGSTHQIALKFSLKYFYAGAFISLIGLLLFLYSLKMRKKVILS